MDRGPAGEVRGGKRRWPFRVGGPWEELLLRIGDTYGERIPEIRQKLGSYVGQEAEGQPITLSGIIGVVSAAGMRGAAQWLKADHDSRAKYPGTTKLFLETNGLF